MSENPHHWVAAVAIVNFDLELGQSIEHVEPASFLLTEQERLNICYLAFPDSNSGCSGDTCYHFRIRKEYNVTKERDDIGSRDSHFYYGYVFFRQTKGEQFKRGYFQKSFVLLTRKPYINLYSNIVQIMAPQYFESGKVAIEVAMHNFTCWEPIVPGKSYQVPLLGQVLSFHIPSVKDKTQNKTSEFPGHVLAPKPVVLRSIVESDVYNTLRPLLPHIGIVWELVLMSEPIVVFGPSPSATSALVQTLVSLTAPLRYANDYRPYFTIHDSEFQEFTSKTHTPSRIILGVTNPYFNKALQHWPNVIILDSDKNKNLKILNPKEHSSSSLRGKPGFYTRYKPFLNKDKNVKKLLRGDRQRPAEVEDIMLRRYLTELTHTLMIPLEQYISSLMPLQKQLNPFRQPPLLQQFQQDAFIASLNESSLKINTDLKGLRGNWKELYRKFIKSPNFELWFQSKRSEANQRLELLHVQQLCEADLYRWKTDKHEVEIVDMLLWIRDRYDALQRLGDYPDLQDHLKNHIDTLLEVVPTDLQGTLKPAFNL